MEYDVVKRAKFIVGAKGGELVCSRAKGDVIWAVGLLPGIHEGKQFADLMPLDAELDVTSEVYPMIPSPDRASRIGYGKGATNSGANPDFKPTNYTAAEQRAHAMLNRVAAESQAMERRMKSFEEASKAKAKAKETVAEDDTPKPDETPPSSSLVEPDPEKPKPAPAGAE